VSLVRLDARLRLLASSFYSNTRHLQLLSNDKVLVIIKEGREHISIFLESLEDIQRAVSHRNTKKTLNVDRVGASPLFSFDEAKRKLAVYSKKV
jgi:hypothetical protein